MIVSCPPSLANVIITQLDGTTTQMGNIVDSFTMVAAVVTAIISLPKKNV